MKKKQILFYTSILMVAWLLTACAEGVGDETEKQPVTPVASNQTAVGFEAYNSRGVTRGGWAGTLTLDQLKESEVNGGGFGVFAYYTDLKKYDQTYVPNFMYNQGVFWNPILGIFDYSPTMYWPNEYGFDAASDDEDHLTFFAYAPFVENASAAAGSVSDATYGITGFSRNTATGDPLVKYIASFEPAKSVDLCWGVVPSDKTAWPRIHNGSTQTLTEGLPWLDVYRPLEAASKIAATTSRIKFKFNHALAQLNVQIDTDADVTTHQNGVVPDQLGAETKVYVRSISFTGVALQGALNLNNTVPNQALWLDYSGMTDLAYGQNVVLHDGRRDGREGVLGAEAPNEKPQGLNPNIIQNSSPTSGVTSTYQNLFKPTSSNPSVALNEAVCVIPTGEAMSITIVYDVETINPDLTTFTSDGVTHGMSIENKITKTVTFGGVYGAGLESNKRYTLKLHLGMNSVKFDADVSDWAENTVDGDAWLPSNTRPILLNKTVMYLGAAQTLTATTDPLGQPIIWDNTDGGTASFTGVAATGAQHIDESYVNNTITMTPIALGTTTVTASLPSGDKATCEVHVVPVTITSRHTTSPNKTTGPGIAIKDTLLKTFVTELTPYCFGAPTTPPVNWTVSPATGVVNISPNAITGVCTVTAVGTGTAVVTCTNTGYTSTPATCTIVVEEKTPTVTAPTKAANWTYDAAAHDLFATAGSVTGGTLSYSVDGTNWYPTYNDAALQATNAGSYTLYYKVTGAAGYADIPSTPLGTVMVAKATPTITLSATSGTANILGRSSVTFTASTPSSADGSTLSVSSGNLNIAKVNPANPADGSPITVKGSENSGTTTITVTSTPSANYNGATATYTVTVDPISNDLNALSWVAAYNIDASSNMGVSDNDVIYDSWGAAMSTASSISGYHLPTINEWWSIIPYASASSSGSYGLFDYPTTSSGNHSLSSVTINSATGLNDVSYWQMSGSVLRAIRFIGTDYCSAWEYEYDSTLQGMVVRSTLIDVINSQSDANTWMSTGSNWGSLNFNPSTNTYASERRFKFFGNGSATVNTFGVWWSATDSGSNARFVSFAENVACAGDSTPKTNSVGLAVRLFRD